MVRHIVRGVGENEALVRSRGLKALGAIIAADPACLEDDTVGKVVTSCLRDKQPSVREAAVDLFGRVLFTQPQKAEHHFPDLCARLQDPSVSVRKRSIKLFQAVVAARPDFKHATEVGRKILLRIGDNEESVQRVVMEALIGMWLQPPTSETSEAEAVVNVRARALCICRVIGSPMEANPQRTAVVARFEDFIRKYLSEGDTAVAELACASIVEDGRASAVYDHFCS